MSLLIQMALEHAAKVEARIIGENLVQHPRWAWMEGMRVCHDHYGPIRVVEPVSDTTAIIHREGTPTGISGAMIINWRHMIVSRGFLSQCYPDLTDPATVGCLQELVRRAHGAVSVSVIFAPFRDEEAGTTPPPYSVFAHGPWPTADRRLSVGRSVIEALALALKA